MTRRIFPIAVLFVGLLFVWGCTARPQGEAATDRGPLKVVVSIPPLADFVRQVGGEDVQVTVLGQGASPHTFEPLPQQARALAQARLVVFNGRNLEPWAPRLVRGVPPGAKILYVTELPAFQKAPYPENAHLWMDIRWARVYVETIRDALQSLTQDQAMRERFGQRAQAYLERLDALDQDLKQTFDQVPAERRKVAVLHAVWEPFLKPYGFTLLPLFPEGYQTHAAEEPSPQDLIRWLEAMRSQQVTVLVLEAQHPVAVLERTAQEAGLTVLYLDPLGGAPPRTTYEAMMQENARALVQALQQAAP